MTGIVESLLAANTLTVVAGTSLLGLSCGAVGGFAVLRRRALVGDALAHAALPGICGAYLIFGTRNLEVLVVGALICGLLCASLISWIRRSAFVREDAAIGIGLSFFFGIGISLSRIIQNLPSGNRSGLDDFIFGKAASMVRSDVILIACISLVTLVLIAMLIKELKVLCFDREFTSALGFKAFALDLLLLAMICLCTVSGLPAVGVVLVSALLIFPGVTARMWTGRLEIMVVLGAAFGLFASVLGTLASSIIPAPANSLSRGYPTGPLIVLSCAILFAISLLIAPERGVIPRWFKRRRARHAAAG